jgi:hypothetical protein
LKLVIEKIDVNKTGIQRAKSVFYNWKSNTLSPLFWIILVVSWFNLQAVFAQADEQTAMYDIRVFGKQIGVFTVTQVTTANTIDVKAITDVNITILFAYRVKFVQHSIFQDGILISARTQTYKNDKINSDMHLERQGETYEVIEDGKSRTFEGSITYSGTLLYFNEPLQKTDIYYERTGVMTSIERIADHSYLIAIEKSKRTNRYHYKDGILVRAELVHPLAVIYLKLRN